MLGETCLAHRALGGFCNAASQKCEQPAGNRFNKRIPERGSMGVGEDEEEGWDMLMPFFPPRNYKIDRLPHLPLGITVKRRAVRLSHFPLCKFFGQDISFFQAGQRKLEEGGFMSARLIPSLGKSKTNSQGTPEVPFPRNKGSSSHGEKKGTVNL